MSLEVIAPTTSRRERAPRPLFMIGSTIRQQRRRSECFQECSSFQKLLFRKALSRQLRPPREGRKLKHVPPAAGRVDVTGQMV